MMSKDIRISKDYIAAGCPDSSEEDLRQLSKSEVAAIRRRVAENPRVPSEVLKKLAADNDYHVRIAVGLNRSCELSIITDLIYDENPDVRFWLASTSYLPERLIFELTEDPNPFVADRARRTLLRKQTDSQLQPASIFEFLEQDHSLAVHKLEHLLKHHSNGYHEDLFDEVIDALSGIRRHFEQQRKCCLELVSNAEFQKYLFRKCMEDQSQIIEVVDTLLLRNADDLQFSSELEKLIDLLNEHVRFAETELFESLRRGLTPQELDHMNQAVNISTHTTV